MDTYEKIEEIVARHFGVSTKKGRKSIGDFMLGENHAVNVKSNNINKDNYSPNMLSIKRMHKWVFEERKELSFVFVDYTEEDGKISIPNVDFKTIPIEKISWECLSIEAQGYGIIQKVGDLKIVPDQTKAQFYIGFLAAYKKFRDKETKKHERFSKKFIEDPSVITW